MKLAIIIVEQKFPDTQFQLATIDMRYPLRCLCRERMVSIGSDVPFE